MSKGTERKMLQSLHVKNLALIDEAEVEFEEGLNILSGETGAGKSIVLGSVNLALGSRYSKEIIREGADYGLVELVFRIRDEKQLKKLKELDEEEAREKAKLSEKEKEISDKENTVLLKEMPSEIEDEISSKPKINIDMDSVIMNDNVITDDEFFDDFFHDED